MKSFFLISNLFQLFDAITVLDFLTFSAGEPVVGKRIRFPDKIVGFEGVPFSIRGCTGHTLKLHQQKYYFIGCHQGSADWGFKNSGWMVQHGICNNSWLRLKRRNFPHMSTTHGVEDWEYLVHGHQFHSSRV